MAFSFGFFNSVNHDRRYNAKQMADVFNGVINDGVFAKVGDIFGTVPGTGLQVIVKSGRAWFDSTWTYSDGGVPLDLEVADVTKCRIDAVVLEVNHEEGVRANSLKIVTGTPSIKPQNPQLINTEYVHQHPLAYVTVKPGSKDIQKQDIDVRVGHSDCPFVTGILETSNIDVLFNQWDGEFDAWFDNVKNQLSGDVAANLQKQIEDRVKYGDKATAEQAKNNGDNLHWITPKTAAIAALRACRNIGDVITTMRDVNTDEFIPCDSRMIDESMYPELYSILAKAGFVNSYQTSVFVVSDPTAKVYTKGRDYPEKISPVAITGSDSIAYFLSIFTQEDYSSHSTRSRVMESIIEVNLKDGSVVQHNYQGSKLAYQYVVPSGNAYGSPLLSDGHGSYYWWLTSDKDTTNTGHNHQEILYSTNSLDGPWNKAAQRDWRDGNGSLDACYVDATSDGRKFFFGIGNTACRLVSGSSITDYPYPDVSGKSTFLGITNKFHVDTSTKDIYQFCNGMLTYKTTYTDRIGSFDPPSGAFGFMYRLNQSSGIAVYVRSDSKISVTVFSEFSGVILFPDDNFLPCDANTIILPDKYTGDNFGCYPSSVGLFMTFANDTILITPDCKIVTINPDLNMGLNKDTVAIGISNNGSNYRINNDINGNIDVAAIKTRVPNQNGEVPQYICAK